eukprot:3781521-Rhodomonas_salina.8
MIRDSDLRQQVAEAILPFDGSYLEHVDEDRKGDKALVKKALRSNPKALQFANDDLRSDAPFVKDAVTIDGQALKYADAQVKKNRAVVMAAVQCGGFNLKYAADKMKKDEETVLLAVRSHGEQLAWTCTPCPELKEVGAPRHGAQLRRREAPRAETHRPRGAGPGFPPSMLTAIPFLLPVTMMALEVGAVGDCADI